MCVPRAVVAVIVLLRYAHVIEKHQNCVLNMASLSTGWICAAGLIMVGNFQVRWSNNNNLNICSTLWNPAVTVAEEQNDLTRHSEEYIATLNTTEGTTYCFFVK